MWILVSSLEKKLYRFYTSNLRLSSADSYFVTTDAFAHHLLYVLAVKFCSAVTLEWKPPVSLTFPLLNDASHAHFST